MSEPVEFDTLLTKQQVAEILNVNETWLNTEIQAGNISHLRLGKKKYIRFRPSHVEEYLASRERPRKENNDDSSDIRDSAGPHSDRGDGVVPLG